jgi:calcineurin-like phosphoesterase family protein
VDSKKVVLCHYPIEDWSGRYRGSIHLHGHIHNQKVSNIKNRLNVSMENIYYYPISHAEVVQRINDENDQIERFRPETD